MSVQHAAAEAAVRVSLWAPRALVLFDCAMPLSAGLVLAARDAYS